MEDAQRTRRARELENVPLFIAHKGVWPAGVRTVGMEELDCLGVDAKGKLYWDGRQIEVREQKLRLTRTQAIFGVVVGLFTIAGSIGAAVQGWAAYNEWACKHGVHFAYCSGTKN